MHAGETWLLNSCSCIFLIKLRMYSVAGSYSRVPGTSGNPIGHLVHLLKQCAGRPKNLVTDAVQYKQMRFALGSRMKVCLKQYSGICPGFNADKLLPWKVIAVMNRAIQLPHKETQPFPFKHKDELVHL